VTVHGLEWTAPDTFYCTCQDWEWRQGVIDFGDLLRLHQEHVDAARRPVDHDHVLVEDLQREVWCCQLCEHVVTNEELRRKGAA
jgi:hypothetical protein